MIGPGETSTITATAISPQNLPLTYSYAASTGSITGNGTAALFSSTQAQMGAVTVTCNVSDDRGNSASASTTVLIKGPIAGAFLSIHSTPAAQVSIDNNLVGMTNAHGDLFVPVKPGAHTLEVTENGYKSYSLTFNVKAGEQHEMSVALASLSVIRRYAARAVTATTEERAPPPGQHACNAFAVFGYPASIDLGLQGPLPYYFVLIAGDFDPEVGIDKTTVANSLCEDEGAQTNCISDQAWASKSKGCGDRAPQSFGSGNGNEQSKYDFVVWTMAQDLPAGVCADPHFPTAWLDISGTVTSRDRCPLKSNGLFTWQWSARVLTPTYNGLGYNRLRLSISSAPGSNPILSDVKDISLVPVPVPALASFWDWVKNAVLENLGGLLFGTGGIFAVLFIYLYRKLRGKPEETVAVQPQPTPVQPQINIFLPPTPQERDSEPSFRNPPPERSGRRRPPGHR